MTPLTRKAATALAEWRVAWTREMGWEPRPEDPLWVWAHARIHTPPRAIVRASERIGRRITVRGLRHTGATRIGRKAGVSPADLQAIGGWASPLIPLQIYSHVNDQRKREVIAKLDEEG
jgi:integrase